MGSELKFVSLWARLKRAVAQSLSAQRDPFVNMRSGPDVVR